MGCRLTILFGLILATVSLTAQEATPEAAREASREAAPDSLSPIRKFPNALTLRTGLSHIGNSFIFNYLDEGIELSLDPIRSNRLTTSLQFRALELDLGFSPGFLNPDEDLEGSRLFSMSFRFYSGRWMQAFTYLDQKGFKADIGGAPLYFREIATRKIGGTTSFVFNPDFSFRAVHSQNEWQLRSAGSFVPRLIAYYTRYEVEGDAGNETAHSYDVALGPGYHYNWVLARHWLLSGGVTTALGINWLEDEGSTRSYWLWDTELRGAFGYNSDRFFAGVNLTRNFLEHSAEGRTRIDDRLFFLEFYAGYRFKAPESWVRTADKFNRTFGLDER